MELRVLGCGDAFGSGGRFNTCFHVTTARTRFLIDCGASTMIAMRRFGIDPNGVETIFLSHLHGDHFGGLPFLILDAQFVSKRTAPLTVAGPPGLRDRLPALMEAMFPGSSTVQRRFALEIIEIEPEQSQVVNSIDVTAFPVRHPSGAPSFALRIGCDGKTLCYSGDTEWVDALVPAARDADLFVTECYTAATPVPFHLNWETLRRHLPAIGARQVLLTHMSADMLGRVVDGGRLAEDGLTVSV